MRILTYSKLFLLLLSINALAEYRVYQYSVSPKFNDRRPSSFIVTSTLDPSTYVTYHGGQASIRINLLKTWTCKGHTGAKQVCKDPLAKLDVEEIAKKVNQ